MRRATNKMSESAVEKALRQAVLDRGGLCYKWSAPGTRGVPDRIVLLPAGRCGFVEVKAPGEKPRAQQVYRLEQLNMLGYPSFVLDSPDQIEGILEEIARLPVGSS